MKSRVFRVFAVLLLAFLAIPALAHAQVIESDNYNLEEVLIGTGGDPELCGDEYCSQTSTGSLVGGDASSDEYGILAGFGSPSEPTLSVGVTNYIVDLGILNESTTGTGVANFTISNYLSNGYSVRILGSTPTNGTYSLDAMDGAGGSVVGTEQFGINLRLNTAPGIGANPVQLPDDTFSFGTPTTAYNQPDVFKYEDGDVIAESDRETGSTAYTMSIISNAGTATPGGRYRTTLVLQVVANF